MITVGDVKAFIEYRDFINKELRGGVMMYDAKDHYKWLTEAELLQHWIDHIYTSHPTMPSDEEIYKQSKISCKGNSHAMRYLPMLNQFRQGAKWMRSLCQAKLAESEREMKEFRQLARLISALNEDHENFKCIAGHIQLARKLLTTTTP